MIQWSRTEGRPQKPLIHGDGISPGTCHQWQSCLLYYQISINFWITCELRKLLATACSTESYRVALVKIYFSQLCSFSVLMKLYRSLAIDSTFKLWSLSLKTKHIYADSLVVYSNVEANICADSLVVYSNVGAASPPNLTIPHTGSVATVNM